MTTMTTTQRTSRFAGARRAGLDRKRGTTATSARRAVSTTPRARIYENILETVGDTPVIKINRMAPEGVEMYVKAEYFNPLSSVKDRLAVAVITDAERRGVLKPERYMSTPLYESIAADMDEEELEIAKSTPSFQL